MPGRQQGSRACFISFAVLLAVLSSGSAMAQGEESSSPDEARAVFLRATELYNSRSYARAEIEFRRAWELLDGHPRRALVLVNIGRCVESQPGREAEALELFERALAETNALAAEDAGIREARHIAEERIAELNARMAARGPEERPESEASRAPASSPSSSSGRAAEPLSPVGPIVLAVGGAMILAGAITGGLALAEHDDVTGMCDAQRMRCPPELEGRANDLAALSFTTDVLLWGGLAVAATGAILTYLLREESGGSLSAGCTETGCVGFVTGSF